MFQKWVATALVLILCVLSLSPSLVVAEGTESPFQDVEKKTGTPFDPNNKVTNGDVKDSFISDLNQMIQQGYVPLFTGAVKIFSIIFVIGIIGMLFGVMLKNGQWQKWATGAMLFSFFVVVLMRVGVYMLYSTELATADSTLNDVLGFITACTQLSIPFLFICGMVLRVIFWATEQPEYFRWSQRVMVGSVALGIVSFVAPAVILNL